jgi:adenylate cyclase
LRRAAAGRGFRIGVVAAAILVATLVLAMREAGLMQAVELWAFDRQLALRVDLTGRATERIVVVGIDEEALQRFGDPVADRVLARVLSRIADDGATAIGLDLFRDLDVPPGTAELDEVLADTRSLVGVFAFAGDEGRSGVAAPAAIAAPERLGFADVPLDADGVVRRGLLFLGGQDQIAWSLSLRVAALALAEEEIVPAPAPENPAWLRLGAATYTPLPATRGLYQAGEPGGYQFLLTFPAGRDGIPVVPFRAVADGRLPVGTFRDRLVFVGLTDTVGARDVLETPIALAEPGVRRLPGVLLHAHIAAQILRQAAGAARPIEPVSDVATAGATLLLAAYGAALGALTRRWVLQVGLVLATLGVIVLSGGVAMLVDRWLSTPTLLAAFVLAFVTAMALAARRHLAERTAFFRLFGMHLSPRIAELAWVERDTFLEHGLPPPQELTATVLVADLAGFTAVTQALSPAELMRWVNRYVGALTAIVDEEGGIVEKYAGDGVMAVFGVPIPRRNEREIDVDAAAAARTALRMRARLSELNARNAADALPAMVMRVGIATGGLIAGTTGGVNRLQYTVLGDAANVAARLESFRRDDPRLGCDGAHARILVAAGTVERLGPGYATELYEAEAALAGRAGTIAVFELLSGAEPTVQR